MQKKCFFKNRSDFKIFAILSKPKNVNSRSIVIMCHGLHFSKNSHVNAALEKIFLKNNIATFQLDFFAHGESQGSKDDANVTEFVDNILRAIRYVKNKGYKNIGLYGASFGGVVSVIAASKSADFKVMALKAPGIGQSSRKISQYKRDFDTKSWINAGKKIEIPVLIIHGTSDKNVEVGFGKELAKSIKNSKIRLYKNADHKFSKKEDFERMVRDISKFIIKHIN